MASRFLLLLSFLVLCASIVLWILNCLAAPVVTKPVLFVIHPGETAREITERLTPQSTRVVWYLWLTGKSRALQEGEYQVLPSDSLQSVLQQMMAGKIYYHHFEIVPGETFAMICLQLSVEPSLVHTVNCQKPAAIAEALGIPAATPEGWLMPDTYFYVQGDTDFALLQRAAQAMQFFLQPAWQQRAPHLPITRQNQALIVASLIEKETARPEEYPLIAAVIYHRLKRQMFLQIDSSVIYGLSRPTTVLTKADLRQKTPYNTYRHIGLPPTPIAMPGRKAIEGALHPADTKALYFVAKGDGSHQFSVTLHEQNTAVQKYQRPVKSAGRHEKR